MPDKWVGLSRLLQERYRKIPAVRFVLQMLAESDISVETRISQVSDIVTPVFDARFIASLMVHHTINQHRLDKKPFEYAFRDALNADGRVARLDPSETNPGADIVIDGVPCSLKTEGAKKISREYIVISKVMESAWMKGFGSLAEFHASIKTRIRPHFDKYQRMFMLRAFPMEILRAVEKVPLAALGPITKKHGTSAVVKLNGSPVWNLKFDGSDDKITLTDLPVIKCRHHASWRVTWNQVAGESMPSLLSDSSSSD